MIHIAKLVLQVRDLGMHEKKLTDLGADEVLSSITDDVPARVKEITHE